jgi:serine/threonine-protein kinase ATR
MLTIFSLLAVLKQLDIDASDSSPDSDSIVDASGKQQMNPWLRGQLEQASVYNIIEPYWTSLYKQNEASKTKSPPFFETSTSCYLWLAEWGRFMVERSNLNKRSCYSKLFFACRSAIRSEAGLGVLEFILPLLVLDSLCFGDDFDRSSTVHELKSVLIMLKESKMEKLELQKSVDIVFTVLQILQCWAENEIEERYKAPRSTGQQATIKSSKSMLSTVWPPDESLSVIEDLLNFIPFDICAEAAAYVGMHAQSLRFLEMHSRKVEAGSLLDSTCHEEEDSQKNNETLDCNKGLLRPTHVVSMDIGLAHRLSGLLDDRDTMTAISRCRKDLDVFDQLHERQSYNDWDGVLRACELAYQINPTQRGHGRFDLETFQTKALLELGHFDSALNQVAGIVNDGRAEGNKSKRLDNDLMAHAINASWRLGRWESLGRLVNILDMKCNDTLSTTLEPDRQYDFKLGKAILGLYQKDHTMVSRSLQEARESIIPSLSVVAGEDYPRAYPYLMKLQCLREVEAVFISERDSVLSVNNQRIQSSSYRDLSTSMDTIAVRLALSRISAEAEVEASLWLSAGRKARKEGLFHLAENSLSHADALYQRLRLSKDTGDPSKLSLSTESNANEVRLQIAKMKHDRGQSAEALRMIEVGEFERILHSHNRKQDLAKLLVDLEKEDQIAPFTRNALQATEWMIESGLQSGSEAIERYKLLNMISPSWERGEMKYTHMSTISSLYRILTHTLSPFLTAHFRYAKYLDSVLESRISVVAARTNGGSADDESARAKIIKKEISCHKYIFEAIKEYGEASRLSQKHVFQALPRLLTLWFDFTAIEGDEDLGAIQEDVNQFMVTCIKSIPPVAYYSVLPQLISRIGHQDEDTATIVGAILKRQLVKFPAQAMWHLSWLRQSVHEDRRQKGEEMFKVAQKSLRKNEDLKNHDLLESSRDLVMFFINLAKYIPKRNDQRSFNVKHNVCKGKAELQDFLPPVQAALTVSRSAVNSSNSRDVFPRQVPRMRAFSSTVQVMSSKAKPKKLTAFAIPEGLKTSEVSNRNSNKPQSCDIGEMHFLVKREAKGDLRKDARVQDLNTVINRLFSNSTSHQAKGVKQHRRLKLRTFSVVCLSEECGILEW